MVPDAQEASSLHYSTNDEALQRYGQPLIEQPAMPVQQHGPKGRQNIRGFERVLRRSRTGPSPLKVASSLSNACASGSSDSRARSRSAFCNIGNGFFVCIGQGLSTRNQSREFCLSITSSCTKICRVRSAVLFARPSILAFQNEVAFCVLHLQQDSAVLLLLVFDLRGFQPRFDQPCLSSADFFFRSIAF